MRVAWFRASSSTSVDDDASRALLDRLRQTLDIELVPESAAHDFVVREARRPYDLCVFEPRNTPASSYIWGYLFQYPGLFVLRDRSAHDSRVSVLERHRRADDYAREFAFNHGHPPRTSIGYLSRGSWPMLKAPLHASRLIVVDDEQRRLELEDAWPSLKVRLVPPFAAGPEGPPPARMRSMDEMPVTVAAIGSTSPRLVSRAVQRARHLGANVVTSIEGGRVGGIPETADIVVSLERHLDNADVTPALTGMAHGKAVIVFEREATAQWPAFDPQTWRARGQFALEAPVVVSIEPRDEEHSLMLAIKGLSQEPQRRLALSAAGRAWWQAHATLPRAAAAWLDVLKEAAVTPRPALPADWPEHLRVAEPSRLTASDLEPEASATGVNVLGTRVEL